jgi:hypothetical protein
MTQLTPRLYEIEAPLWDRYEVCVSFILAIVVVSSIWLIVVLCCSIPMKSPKPIERPLYSSDVWMNASRT